MRTSELTGAQLDWAVAKCEGRALRYPVSASYSDVLNKLTPFYLHEVISTYDYDEDKCVEARVAKIKITRCGIHKEVGATSPSISFTDSTGRKARGSIEMFYFDRAEADLAVIHEVKGGLEDFSPSTNWAQGGPIIEREGICITYDPFVNRWAAIVSGGDSIHADTTLVAAMLCYVASKLGDIIEIPEELA